MAAVDSLPVARESNPVLESTLIYTGWTVGTLVVSLLLWILLPALLLGWKPMAITSGSMTPLIRAGDVVLIDPEFGRPAAGSVVAYDDGASTVVHRVVEAHPDGSLTTKGDANRHPDTTIVSADRVIGTGRLLVPFIGLLRTVGWVWLSTVMGLIAVAAIIWRKRPVWSFSVVILSLVLAGLAMASAAFAGSTSNDGSSLSAVLVAPPSNLTATCGAIGAGAVDVNLTWTASGTAGVSRYHVYHDEPSAGTTWVEVGTTAPSVTTFTHQIPTQPLSIGAHTYAVQTAVGPWHSPDSNTDSVNVSQIVLVWTCS